MHQKSHSVFITDGYAPTKMLSQPLGWPCFLNLSVCWGYSSGGELAVSLPKYL